MKQRICRNCVYAVKVGGSGSATLRRDELICINRENSEGQLFFTENTEKCRNFQPRERVVNRPKVTQPENGEIKLIPLTKGKFAIVDAGDYEQLSKYKWYTSRKACGFYAIRRKKGKITYMHREIMNPPKGMVVDHKDRNGLNNRRSNLRLCTLAENTRNQQGRKGSSRYKGVFWDKECNKWRACIMFNKRTYQLGRFEREVEAAKVYDKKAKELFGEFAYLNFPQPQGSVRIPSTHCVCSGQAREAISA